MDEAWESLSSGILYNSFVYRDRVRNIQCSVQGMRDAYLRSTAYAVLCPCLGQIVVTSQLAERPDQSGIRSKQWLDHVKFFNHVTLYTGIGPYLDIAQTKLTT